VKPGSYGPFPYSPIIERPRLTWPNDARVAFWVIPNIEFFALDEKVPAAAGGSGIAPPNIPEWASRDYGNRVGIFRMMDVMDRYGIRGTVALNSNLCAQHPQIIKAGEDRGWEWMGHNQTNTQRLNAIPAEQEQGVIEAALATIEKATGRRPAGWLGSGLQETWNTLEYLAGAGLQYVADWVNDDQPYYMNLENGKRLVSVPYSWHINDKPAFEQHNYTADQFREMICRQFDVLYREGATSGRVMAVALHPYLTGLPYRIAALDAAFEYVCRHDGVWLTTGSEIARHYIGQSR
jgi:peptidoglycan/xylan/chitin deacetylase (PgdA/CDA1 family)